MRQPRSDFDLVPRGQGHFVPKGQGHCNQDGLRVIENLEVNTFLPYFATDTMKLSLSAVVTTILASVWRSTLSQLNIANIGE